MPKYTYTLTRENVSLKPYNGYRVEATAKLFAPIHSGSDIMTILQSRTIRDMPKLVLGQGFNTLPIGNIDRLVMLNKIKGVAVVDETDDYVILKVGTGEDWINLVRYTVKRGWGGMENMTMIYGTVGSSVAQNIAAYGQQTSDLVVDVEAVELSTGKLHKFTADQCGYEYRESFFKNKWFGKYFLTYVTLKLTKKPKVDLSYWSYKHGAVSTEIKKMAREPFTVADIERTLRIMRLNKFGDALKGSYGMCGSHFKNPNITKEKYLEIRAEMPALQYYPVEGMKYPPNDIDALPDGAMVRVSLAHIFDEVFKFRNYWEGHVGVSENQALNIYTDGEASGQEVLDFTDMMVRKMKERFDVDIEREVKVIKD